jgi:hypothetical protein
MNKALTGKRDVGHMIHIAQFTFGELPCIPGERKGKKVFIRNKLDCISTQKITFDMCASFSSMVSFSLHSM